MLQADTHLVKATELDPDTHVGTEPEGAEIEEMGFGWTSTFASGKGSDTITSGFEGAWTANPTQWDNGYFDLLFGYEWEQVTTPAGAIVWHAIDPKDEDLAPDAQDASVKVPTMMTTADMALREDPIYNKISKRFHENPEELADAFARAWFKLLHRDMGPVGRYLGPEVPSEELIWQDPVPAGNTGYDVESVKSQISDSGLTIQEMVETAWASASTFRGSDMRGGANGARIRLAPQKDWEANKPEQLSRVLAIYEGIASNSGASIADVIVLAGNVGIEKASGTKVDFTPGRGDSSQEQTDIESFEVLEPVADGFRNFQKASSTMAAEEMMLDKAQLLGLTAPEMTVLLGGMRSLGISNNEHGIFTDDSDKDGFRNFQKASSSMPAEEMMLDKAQLLGLTAPEMTVLLGGMRSLGISNNEHGIFTDDSNKLTNDYFATLLDMSVQWKPNGSEKSFIGTDRVSGEKIRTASRVDLAFGSNSQLRAIAEVYASSDAHDKFVKDFVSAWNKVMNIDIA